MSALGHTENHMKRIKPKSGRTVRLPESALAVLEELRDKMKRTTHIGGMLVNPIVKLGDGVVLSWALAMTNYLMNPRFSVIDREEFADKFDKQLEPHLAELANCTPEERKARIGLLVAAASEGGGYNTSETLRAAGTGPGKPS